MALNAETSQSPQTPEQSCTFAQIHVNKTTSKRSGGSRRWRNHLNWTIMLSKCSYCVCRVLLRLRSHDFRLHATLNEKLFNIIFRRRQFLTQNYFAPPYMQQSAVLCEAQSYTFNNKWVFFSVKCHQLSVSVISVDRPNEFLTFFQNILSTILPLFLFIFILIIHI